MTIPTWSLSFLRLLGRVMADYGNQHSVAVVSVVGDALIIETLRNGGKHITVIPLGKLVKRSARILAGSKKEVVKGDPNKRATTPNPRAMKCP
jgi:hypothetical protein